MPLSSRQWPAVRAALCDDAIHRVRGAGGILWGVKEKCEYVRKVMYKGDSRWKTTASDPGYAKLFGHKKWWMALH